MVPGIVDVKAVPFVEGADELHTPLKINGWNIIMEVWKIVFLSKRLICRFHVNLPGCTVEEIPKQPPGMVVKPLVKQNSGYLPLSTGV